MAAERGPWGAPCHLLPPPAISGRPSSTPGGGGTDGSISKCAHLGTNNKERLSESVPPSPPAHSTFSLRPGWGEWYAALSETPDPKLSLQGEGLSILPSPGTRGLSNSEQGRAGQGRGFLLEGPVLSFFPSLFPCFLCPACYRPGIAPMATWHGEPPLHFHGVQSSQAPPPSLGHQGPVGSLALSKSREGHREALRGLPHGRAP